MNRGHLPGFYFDEERGKYFKIVADGPSGRNPGHDYTRDGIRKRDNEKTMSDRRKRRKLTCISRSPMLQTCGASSMILARELGTIHSRGQLHSAQADGFINGSSLVECHLTGDDRTYGHAFAYQAEPTDLIMSARKNRFNVDTGIVRFHPSESWASERHSISKTVSIRDQTVQLRDVIASPDGHVYCVPESTAMGAPRLTRIRLMHASSDRHSRYDVQVHTTAVQGARTLCINPGYGKVRDAPFLAQYNSEKNIWMQHQLNGPTYRISLDHDITSMAFMTPLVLAIGLRTGVLVLWDTRNIPGGRLMITERLSIKQGPIVDIFPINQRYIVVRPAYTYPRLYDLYNHKSKHPDPVMWYGDRRLKHETIFHADVDARLGVVMTCGPRKQIKMMNLWSGRLIRTVQLDPNGIEEPQDRPTVIKFVDTPRGLELLGSFENVEFKVRFGPLQMEDEKQTNDPNGMAVRRE